MWPLLRLILVALASAARPRGEHTLAPPDDAAYQAWREAFDQQRGGYADCWEQRTCPASTTTNCTVSTVCAQRPAATAATIRVACVGDSITAGTMASSAAATYPAQLQRALGDAYSVTNLGVSSTCVQSGCDLPYTSCQAFAAVLESEWDIVVFMLGSNDAADGTDVRCSNRGFMNLCALRQAQHAEKDPDGVARNNWRPNSAQIFARDYDAVLAALAGLGRRSSGGGRRRPAILLAIPPPLVMEGAGYMSSAVVNEELPQLVRDAATRHQLPPPIDIPAAFGVVDGDAQTSDAVRSLFTGCPRSLQPPEVPLNWMLHDVLDKPREYAALSAAAAANGWCDFIHPNDDGYGRIAHAVAAAIHEDVDADAAAVRW